MQRTPYWLIEYGVLIDLLAIPVIIIFCYGVYRHYQKILKGETRFRVSLYQIRSVINKEKIINVFWYGFLGSRAYQKPITGIFQKTFLQLKETYSLTYQGEESNSLDRFRLHPKEEKLAKFLSRVDLWIDRASGTILRFEMIEAGKERLFLEFKDLQINPPLKDEDLTIRIPPSARVREQISP